MAVDNIIPDTGIVELWWDGDVTDINEGPATDNLYIQAAQSAGDDNDVDMYGFTTIADVQEVTQIVLWINGFNVGGGSPEFTLDCGGVLALNVETGLTGVRGWRSHTFSGLHKTQANLDGLLVSLTADVPSKENTNTIYTVYCVITYTPVSVGYGHDFMGVPAANIDSINGIPSANIDTIKGV